MSDETWCKGCEPAIVNLTTQKLLPEDHPSMKAALKFWKEETTREERDAIHRVTCDHSEAPKDETLAKGVWQRMSEVLKRADSAN